MKIKIGKLQITVFEIVKLETFKVEVNKEASKQEANAIKDTESFKELTEKAKALRALRA